MGNETDKKLTIDVFKKAWGKMLVANGVPKEKAGVYAEEIIKIMAGDLLSEEKKLLTDKFYEEHGIIFRATIPLKPGIVHVNSITIYGGGRQRNGTYFLGQIYKK